MGTSEILQCIFDSGFRVRNGYSFEVYREGAVQILIPGINPAMSILETKQSEQLFTIIQEGTERKAQ